MKYPKITIVTPSYNQAQFLEETMLSIIDQDYPELELIVMDGGSTDGSVDIIKKYSDKISYWVSRKDGGNYNAINKALEIFSGDYWCVINSDDALKPGALKKIAGFIEANNNPEWITAGVEFIDQHSNKLGNSIPLFPKKISGMYFLNECWIYHPVTFLSRKIYQNLGPFRKTDILDYDYWLRAEELGYLPTVIPQVLGNLRYHANCKSMDFLKIYRCKIDLLSTYLHKVTNDELKVHIRELELSYLQSEAKLFLFNKKYGKTTKTLMNSLVRYPFLLFKRWPYGLLRRYFSGINEAEVSPMYFLKNMK